MSDQRFVFGDFVLDAGRGTLLGRGVVLSPGNRALALLKALVHADGHVVTKAALMDAAWPGSVVEESNLSVQIAALRKLLGPGSDGGEPIVTVARVGYRFAMPVRVDSSQALPPGPAESRIGIAVLPLANLSGDPSQEYFAEGVTEDLIMALSRFRWFRVIGRSGSFAFKDRRVPAREIAGKLAVSYLLEGSIRKAGGRVRIALQLIQAESEMQIWGEHYDVDEDHMLGVQDSVAAQVAGAMEPELLRTAATEAARRAFANPGAQDLVYRAVWLFHKVGAATHLEARDLLREACALDPAFDSAKYWLARVSAGIVAYGWTSDPQAALNEGVAAAIQAIRADERNPYAHYALAIISVYALAFDQAQEAAGRAIELAPGFALGHLVSGMAQLFSGKACGAIGPLSHGLELNPFDPQNFVWYTALAYAHLFAGRASQALVFAAKAQEIRPDWPYSVECAICASRAGGDDAGARTWSERLKVLPREGLDPMLAMRHANPHWNSLIDGWLGARER